jgi:hypothetical protein
MANTTFSGPVRTTLAFDAVAEAATLVWNSSIGWVLTADRGVTIA